MPHMLAQEHMGMVDALRYGTTRNAATLAAALSAIGATPATLVLTLLDDGVWTLETNLTIPINVTLWLPAGVTLFRNAGTTLTLVGNVISFTQLWETGPGSTVRNQTGYINIDYITGQSINFPVDGVPFIMGRSPVGTPPGPGRQILIYTDNGDPNSPCGIAFRAPPQDVSHQWHMEIDYLGSWALRRPGSANTNIYCNDAGTSLSNKTNAGPFPTHVLQMIVDDAFKATTLWSVPSDARLKTVLGDFTDGLATLCALPQSVRFQWNGKGGTLDDGREYVGRIAQDTLPVAPYLIRTYQDKLEPTDPQPTDLYSANDSPVIEMLINAVKELATRVEALEAAGPALLRRDTAPDEEEPEPRPSRRKRSNG